MPIPARRGSVFACSRRTSAISWKRRSNLQRFFGVMRIEAHDDVGRAKDQIDKRRDRRAARQFPGRVASHAVGDEHAVNGVFGPIGHGARRQVRDERLHRPIEARHE